MLKFFCSLRTCEELPLLTLGGYKTSTRVSTRRAEACATKRRARAGKPKYVVRPLVSALESRAPVGPPETPIPRGPGGLKTPSILNRGARLRILIPAIAVEFA
jgi:hypothetical protein